MTADQTILTLHAETAALVKRRRTSVIRAARTTRTKQVVVEADLTHDEIVVERVAIGRAVDAVPPVRQEGDVTIMPVMEEMTVIEKRLVLREEVHVRRVRVTQRHTQTVELREQHVAVTRTDADD